NAHSSTAQKDAKRNITTATGQIKGAACRLYHANRVGDHLTYSWREHTIRRVLCRKRSNRSWTVLCRLRQGECPTRGRFRLTQGRFLMGFLSHLGEHQPNSTVSKMGTAFLSSLPIRTE